MPQVYARARGASTRRRLIHCGEQVDPDRSRSILNGDPVRYTDRFDFAFVDGAAHFITDDAPEAVAELIVEHFVAVEAAA
jgi:hypothetical protein